MNCFRNILAVALALSIAAPAVAEDSAGSHVKITGTEYLWTRKTMPDCQAFQLAAPIQDLRAIGFDDQTLEAEQANPSDAYLRYAKKHSLPYLQWYEKPADPNGACLIFVSGGSYINIYDVPYFQGWADQMTAKGYQCVNLVYRTPRPEGLPIYQSAWEDGQRGVKMVRSQAAERGFDPERIAVMGISAGAHMTLLLAANSQTPAYEYKDEIDAVPCHINLAVAFCPAYTTTDSEAGTRATMQSYGTGVTLSKVFNWDSKTCPIILHQGGQDPYGPNGSTLIYRQLRKMGIPAEVHLYSDEGHGVFGFDRAAEFMRQLNFDGRLQPEVAIMDRYPNDDARASNKIESVWPDGLMPDAHAEQCTPYLEWHFPKDLKSKSIQIIYSGGSYVGNGTDGFEVAPMRRYLNERGVTVVTMVYRTPRIDGRPKYEDAWMDLQRAIRVVRSQAAEYGLDPDKIGIMGSSAGGHLTLMGVTSSLHRSYLPIDEIDTKYSCGVQWGVGIYPAYALTDGDEWLNTTGGNDDSAVLVPEFSFDLATAPMVLIHGDADGWAAMNSVKVWEKMRAIGVQCDLHTLALRGHCFQNTASPETGSYTWMDRVWEFLVHKGLL